jgi:hypothetical protein
MKTLVIHPTDPTTEELKMVYEPIRDKTVITGGVTREEIRRLIVSHDRIMLMGHGSEFGLLSVSQFPETWVYAVDYTMADLLRLKEDSVFIFCFASAFARKFHIRGFFTGMFISELRESVTCGFRKASEEAIRQSVLHFCNHMSRNINEDAATIYSNVTRGYGRLAGKSGIAMYNFRRLELIA